MCQQMSIDPFDDFASSQNFVPDSPSTIVDETQEDRTLDATGRRLREFEDISPLRRVSLDATVSDVGMKMKQKAELGFGLDVRHFETAAYADVDSSDAATISALTE
jgi:hypothetical protein